MDRRAFIKICSTTAAAASIAPCFNTSAQAAELLTFERVKLVDDAGNTIKAAQLSTAESCIFNYPYLGTPSFLINLGKSSPGGDQLNTSDGSPYTWRGGVGSQHTIVAYSAICAHQLSYPNKEVSFIAYNPNKSEIAGRAGVITCCAHNSVYDPSTGAKVLSGPAAGPLAAVALEHDSATDALYATGVYGGQLFDDFFKAYRTQLNVELGAGKAKQITSGTATVMLATAYSKMRLQC